MIRTSVGTVVTKSTRICLCAQNSRGKKKLEGRFSRMVEKSSVETRIELHIYLTECDVIGEDEHKDSLVYYSAAMFASFSSSLS